MKSIAVTALLLLFLCSGPVFADQDHDKGHDRDHDKTLTDRGHDRDHDKDKGGPGGTGGAGSSGGRGGSATGGSGGSATANGGQGGNATANGGNVTANGGNASANGGTVNSSNTNTANGGSVNNSGNSSNRNSNRQSQSQNQTANGGNVSGSGNSTVKNTSTNNNSATGGQGGAGGQGGTGGNATATNTLTGGNATGGTQSQSASASGNDSFYSSTTNVEAPKIPVSTAYSPTSIPTVPCFKGFGAGVQTAPVGASFGGGKIDENCAILETARSFALSGSRLAYCKTMLINKYAKKAGVTLDDCMRELTPTAAPAPAIAAPVPLPVAPHVVAAVPAAITAPVVAVPIANFRPQLVGICTFASNFECNLTSNTAGDPTHVTTICDRMITQAIKLLEANPGTVVKVIGNENSREREATNMYALARAKNVQRKFIAAGIPEASTVVVTGGSGDRTVEVWVVPASDSAYARRSN